MSAPASYPFLKGHGTENDFVLLPDHDGTAHGELSADRVRALCDRRAGIGGDGVLRVVSTSSTYFRQPVERNPELVERNPELVELVETEAEWFMDYRNSDGSLSEMCGNGIRVFGQYLALEGLVDPGGPVPVATRDGVKTLTFAGGRADGEITVDVGTPKVLGQTEVSVTGRGAERRWPATHIDMGNPHAVAWVDDLGDVGPLRKAPGRDPSLFPDGVNVEFVVRRGPAHVAMRVHERGSGETRSCGTGACAVMVAAALSDDAARDTDYQVDLPGGTLRVRWTSDDRILMTGPAVIVARGTTSL